jgi:hypothetical protein
LIVITLTVPSTCCCYDLNNHVFLSRYDLENAFSPPTDDDGFFFIPYPKTLPSATEGEPKVVSARQFKPISQTFELQDSPKQQQTLKSIQNIEACQPYLPKAKTCESILFIVYKLVLN